MSFSENTFMSGRKDGEEFSRHGGENKKHRHEMRNA
jgi:hypothetical protein